MEVSNVHRQTVLRWSFGGDSAFILGCRRQSVGSGGSRVTSSTLSSAVASAETTSCWGSPFLGEACWPPHRKQTLLSSSALGDGPIPQVQCWRQGTEGCIEGLLTFPCFVSLRILNWTQHQSNYKDDQNSHAVWTANASVPEHSDGVFYCPGFHSSLIRDDSVHVLLQGNLQVALFCRNTVYREDDKRGAMENKIHWFQPHTDFIRLYLNLDQVFCRHYQPQLYLSALFPDPPASVAHSEAPRQSGHESLFLQVQPPSGLCLLSWQIPHPEVAGFPSSSPGAQASSSPCRPATTEGFIIRR